MAVEIARKLLARGAAKLGGVEALGQRLNISHRVLTMYIEGKEPVPDSLLLRAIDVILEDVPNRVPLSQPDVRFPPKTTLDP